MARNYSSITEARTLGANVPQTGTNSDRVTLSPDNTGFPTVPFVLVLNPDTASEEVVLATSLVSGTTYLVTRNIEGGGVKTHTSGQVVKHMIVASDLQIVHDHFSNDSLTAGTAHGVAGGVVGRTSSQTLTNKAIALGDNTVTGTKAQFNAAMTDADFVTITGTETLTNKTLTSPIITGASITSPSIASAVINTSTINSPAITGTITGTGVVSSTNILNGTIVNDDIATAANIVATKLTGTISEFNTALTGNDFATLAGIETLTNKTLTSPKINEDVALTATATQLNRVDATSSIQTQLNGKQATITGAATTIDTEDLTVSRALVSDASGKVAVSNITSTELALLDGLTNTGWDTDPGSINTAWDATGWYARAKKFLGITTIYLYLVRDGSTISNTDVAGNMTDTTVYTLDAAFRPTYAHTVHFDIDGKTGGSAIINEDGTIVLRSMYDEDSSILNGDSIRIAATFIV